MTGPATRSDVEELYLRHATELRRYLHRRGGSRAEDLVGDVFVIALQRLDALPSPAMRRAWLFGTARRLLLASQRASRRRHEAEHEHARFDDGGVASSNEGHADQHGAVREALDSLSESDRELIRLTEWEQLSTVEAGLVLGLRPGTARVRLHRARRRLADHPSLRSLVPSPDDGLLAAREEARRVQT